MRTILNEPDGKPGYYYVRLPEPGEHGFSRGRFWFVKTDGVRVSCPSRAAFVRILADLGVGPARVAEILRRCLRTGTRGPGSSSPA